MTDHTNDPVELPEILPDYFKEPTHWKYLGDMPKDEK